MQFRGRGRWLLLPLLCLLLPRLSQAEFINGDLFIVGVTNYCADAGSTDAYACTPSDTRIATYTDGAWYSFKANTINTGAATFNFNSLGAKTIKKLAGNITTDLVDGDICAGQRVLLQYDGTNMQMQSPVCNLKLTDPTGNGLAVRTAAGVTTARSLAVGSAKLTVANADGTGGNPTLDCATASTTVSGCVELADSTETTAGTDATRAVTPDGLAGSDFGKRYITIECVADATALTTGDGKCYWPVHPDFNTWVIVGVSAHVGAAVSSSGAVNVDIDVCGAVATGIRCSGTNRDLLSTNITIDANEDGTETAATPAVINTANDDLATGEWVRFNIDGAGTGTQGLYVTVVIQKP